LGDVTSQGGVIDNIEPTNIVNTGSSPLSAKNFRLNPAGCAGGLCTLEANGALTETGSATLNLINANDANQKLTVSNINFWQNARVSSLSVVLNNKAPAANIFNTTSANINTVTAQLVDSAGVPLPAGVNVRFMYQASVGAPPALVAVNGTTNNYAVSPASGSIFTTDSAGKITLNIVANDEWAVKISSLSSAIAGGLPSSSFSVESNFVYTCVSGVSVGGLRFDCPRWTYKYVDANTYCSSLHLMTGGGAWRLPSLVEMQSLGAVLPNNSTITLPFRWTSTPSSAGAHYAFQLLNDIPSSQLDTLSLPVGCVR
ncbi:MAG: hypothetical protein ACRC9W_06575, partial [Plesiomonas sp.]